MDNNKGCDACKSNINLDHLTSSSFRNNIFVKIILFIIGCLLLTIIIPIFYVIVFRIVFFNKELGFNLLNSYMNFFNLKKKNIKNDENLENK